MLRIYKGSEDLQEVMVIDRVTGTCAWHCVYISQMIQNTEKRPWGRLCQEQSGLDCGLAHCSQHLLGSDILFA